MGQLPFWAGLFLVSPGGSCVRTGRSRVGTLRWREMVPPVCRAEGPEPPPGPPVAAPGTPSPRPSPFNGPGAARRLLSGPGGWCPPGPGPGAAAVEGRRSGAAPWTLPAFAVQRSRCRAAAASGPGGWCPPGPGPGAAAAEVRRPGPSIRAARHGPCPPSPSHGPEPRGCSPPRTKASAPTRHRRGRGDRSRSGGPCARSSRAAAVRHGVAPFARTRPSRSGPPTRRRAEVPVRERPFVPGAARRVRPARGVPPRRRRPPPPRAPARLPPFRPGCPVRRNPPQPPLRPWSGIFVPPPPRTPPKTPRAYAVVRDGRSAGALDPARKTGRRALFRFSGTLPGNPCSQRGRRPRTAASGGKIGQNSSGSPNRPVIFSGIDLGFSGGACGDIRGGPSNPLRRHPFQMAGCLPASCFARCPRC
jgi:hypothetical protein